MFKGQSFLVSLIVSMSAGLGMAMPVINEIMANNRSTVADAQGEFDDWVEVFNPGASELDLSGYYFSDDPEEVTKWQVPLGSGMVVPAGGYATLWLDDDVEDGADHVGVRLAAEGDVLILTAPDGVTVVEQVVLPGQHPDISYGRDEAGEFRYLINPTPGLMNDPTGVAVLEGVTFSREQGTFETGFDLVLATSSEGASIRYTVDGTRPSNSNGAVYGSPVMVESTSCVRAALFLGASQISPVEIRVYLEVDAGMAGFDSDLPIILLDSQGYDFSDDDDPRTDYPSQSVCAGVFENEAGRTSVTAAPQFAGRAGLNVRGASSKTWPKKQFKFETWDEEDNDRDVSLLGMPAESDWLLQAPYFDKTLMRNEFVFHWWREMGYYSPRTRYVEVFLNPDPSEPFSMDHYQGVYLLTEKIKRSAERMQLAGLDAGDVAEPEITGGYMVQATNLNEDWVGGEGTRYKYVDPAEDELLPVQRAWLQDFIDAAEDSVYAANFADPEEGYAKYLDVPSQVDYDIMRELSRNTDGASTFFSIDRGEKLKMGPLWDYNQALGLSSLGTSSLGYGYETDGWNGYYMRAGHWLAWWNELDDDPVYQQAWNDRWVELRESTLTTDALLGKIDGDAALLDEAQMRNFAKWDILGVAVYVVNGRTRADPGDLGRDTYEKEVTFLRDWVEDRVAWIDSQVPSPPDFSQNGGAVPQGYSLVMSEGTSFGAFSGDLFYTTDGSDPAEPGGSAIQYTGPIVLNDGVRVRARTMSPVNGSWGALRDATFVVGTEPASSANLVISEIHYNPRGSDDLEFIEIVNRGSVAVDLTGVKLASAVDFEFGAMALEPDGVLLVVEDEVAFAEEFGMAVAGQWTGRLSNGGETIDLLDAAGGVLHRVAYGQDGEWPSGADGDGFSLQLRDLNSDPSLAGSWRLSAQEDGNPGDLTLPVEVTFEDWQGEHFTVVEMGQPEVSGLYADPDGDGFSNLLEYGLSSLPMLGASQPAMEIAEEEIEVGGVTGRYVTLTFDRPLGSELSYALQTSSDLVSWESRPLIWVRGSVNLGTQIETLTIRGAQPIDLGGRALMRIYLSK
ncbi:MAG: CotH kinase family protein [Akkermansiaceae bacterium]